MISTNRIFEISKKKREGFNMSKVDKRTIEATYASELITIYADRYPTIYQVLSRYLSKCGYSHEEIERIVEEETFDSVIDAMRFGDFLATLKMVMESFAHIEYKSVSEINTHFEKILARRYGVTECDVYIYTALSPALKRLVSDGYVDAQEHPDNSAWKVYKYIGK